MLVFFDASNWHINEEQKDHLLDFGLNKLKLTPEQQEQLTIIHSDQFKTFTLTGSQKNILNSLSPLIREDKYSEESLQLFKSLNLKPQQQNFFVREEIIPDPNTQFGSVKSSYLPLKTKFLGGEQKVLRVKLKEQEQQEQAELVQKKKNSILKSLLEFGREVQKVNQNLQFAEKKLKKEIPWESWETEEGLKKWAKELKDWEWGRLNYSLDQWTQLGILENWQRDVLLTCGFKTIPKYNFFELLTFAVEKLSGQDWSEFLQGNEDLAEAFEKYSESLKNQPITINQIIWEKYASSQSKEQREIIKELNLKEIVEEQINKALGNWQPPQPTEETFYDSSEELETKEPEPEQSTSSTSRYDDLFANLSKEDAAKQKKKLERQEAQKKFEEAERKRREQKLSEKDRKLKEDEERRQKERELAELEEQKRRAAEAARAESLQKEQEALFQKKMANIEEAKRRAEENLANQIKKNELEEKKKREEIEKMEKENQAEQERLKKQAELIEEEKQKKLAQIALEDQEERQRIEKRANEEKARIQEEINRKKQENERELKKKENQMLKEKEVQKAELEKLDKEIKLQESLGQELKELGNIREAKLRGQKNQREALNSLRTAMYNACLDFYLNTQEIQKGTRYNGSPVPRSGCHYLRDLVRDFPGMTFNLHFGDIYEGNWGGWGMAMKTFYKAVGSQFVNTTQLRQIIDREVQTTDYLDNR